MRKKIDGLVRKTIDSPHLKKRVLLVLLLFGAFSVFILLAAYILSFQHGLTGHYHDNITWAGPPILTVRDRTITLHRLGREAPAYNCSIQWTGVIHIPASGTYEFATASDDGSALYLDEKILVDNGGFHGLEERSDSIFLEQGFHAINISYFQGSGSAGLIVYWKRPGKERERLSQEFLFPQKPKAITFIIERMVLSLLTGLKLLWGMFVITGFLTLLNSRRIILPLLRTTGPGKACARIYAWAAEDEEGSPRRPLLPEEDRPLPKPLVLILFVSLLLNGCGFWWGLPHFMGWAPDELTPALVRSALEQGFYYGDYIKYPLAHYYLLTLVYTPLLLLDKLHVINIESFQAYTMLFYIGRLVSVFMGTATVFFVYVCGRELYERRASLFAAFITALIAPFVYYSKVINLDVPYSFWFALSLCFYIRVLKYHKFRDYLLFAGTAVLSICTKDQAYGLYLLTPIPIVLTYHFRKKRKNASTERVHSIAHRKMILALVFAVVLFLVLHNIVFNVEGFLKHIRVITGPASQGYKLYENTISGHARMLWQNLKHLRFSFGWPLYLICLLGVGLAFIRKKNRFLLWLLIPAISYYLSFISIVLYNYVRFLIPICIILAFFGGKFLSEFLAPTRRWYTTKIGVVSVIFAYSFFYAASVDILMINDSRYHVEQWMAKNIDEHSLIGLIGETYTLPRLKHFTERSYLYRPYRDSLHHAKPDYLIINSDRAEFEGPANKEFFSLLDKGKLGYTLVLQYKRDFTWLPLHHEIIVQNNRKLIFSNLEYLNPGIKIFKRSPEP